MGRTVETEFIKNLIMEGRYVTIHTRNGFGFEGVITEQDDLVLLVKVKRNGEMVREMMYKHNVSTICPVV